MKKFRIILCLLSTLIAIASCRKEDNTKIAPITHSDWVTPAAYTKTTVFSTIHFTYDIVAAEITQDVLNNATVLVYGKLNGYNKSLWPTDQVAQMPIVVNYQLGAIPEIDTWSALISEGRIRIDMTNNSNNIYLSLDNNHSFRYIILPKNLVATSSVNFKDYNQVQNTFHL